MANNMAKWGIYLLDRCKNCSNLEFKLFETNNLGGRKFVFSQETQENIETCGEKGSELIRMGGVGILLETDDCQISCYYCLRAHWPDAVSDICVSLLYHGN